MDLILEGFDTFVFDHLYATLLPVKTPGFAANATISSVSAEPSAYPWQYQPSSSFISFTPSQNAYASSLPRDDWRREFVSLYLITWYVARL
jgi:lathosterol oxidase